MSRIGNFDITPDGRRFVFILRGKDSEPPATLGVVLNWTTSLETGRR